MKSVHLQGSGSNWTDLVLFADFFDDLELFSDFLSKASFYGINVFTVNRLLPVSSTNLSTNLISSGLPAFSATGRILLIGSIIFSDCILSFLISGDKIPCSTAHSSNRKVFQNSISKSRVIRFKF